MPSFPVRLQKTGSKVYFETGNSFPQIFKNMISICWKIGLVYMASKQDKWIY